MRLSAIAEELITRGQEVIFVGNFSEISWLSLRIRSLRFSQTFFSTESFIPDHNTDVLILDSYIVPIHHEFIERRKWKAIVAVVDELTPLYLADLFIHPGLSLEWRSNSTAKVISGPRYIPFRKAIQKNMTLEAKKEVLEVLVIGGGTDSFNFVRAICEVLANIKGNMRAHILTNDPFLAMLDSRFTAIPIGSELDILASTSELVFTTASTTSLEFVAREVAIGVGCAVDNQEKYYETLSSAGVASPIGRFVAGKWELDHSQIVQLTTCVELRETLRSNCAELIDLDGASRIADEIMKL
jgi:spore coat polysaccharide biosynthesis predicted glycosyltransferase SpsG